VTELDSWGRATINVSDLGITSFTSRVSALLNHPIVARLAQEYQLGMLDTVFPTATHSRLQHSLGVFHAVTQYITALYYDPENPTFRVLFSPQDCRRALLASVVHDVGHTTFGHELEEVDQQEFSHTTIGELILRSMSPKDVKGRTIREVIEGTDPDCWGVDHSSLLNLVRRKIEKPTDAVYRDILDGQLDADKLDYLVRDTVECRVQYGRGIDHQRFLRSLTTSAVTEGPRAVLRLAVKRKGAASAEAFAFARYQLYQALYWHHTFRAIKAMLLTAAAETLRDLKRKHESDMFSRHPLMHAYARHVIGIDSSDPSPETKRGKKSAGETVESRIDGALGRGEDPKLDGKYARDPTLLFLWRLASGKPRRLVEDLMTRRYYKRVVEIPLGSLREDSWLKLREAFKSDRLNLQRRVEDALVNALRTAIQDQMKLRESLVRDKALERLGEVQAKRHVFVLDLPLRGWTSSGDDPPFVSDYKRRHFRAGAGLQEPAESKTLWSDHVGPLMRRIAYFRVFCESEIHRIVTRTLGPNDVLAALKDEMPELK